MSNVNFLRSKKGMNATLGHVLIGLVFSIAGILAMYYDARPVWIGLPALAILVACSGLIGGKFVGLITGAVSSVAGMYLKINYYYVPTKYRVIPENLSPEKLEKLTKRIAKFHDTTGAYGESLAKYFILVVVVAIAIGYLAGYFSKNSSKASVNASEHLDKERSKSSLFSIQKMTLMSVFIAIAVVINTVRIGSISFSGFPIICSGIWMGSGAGFLVGAIADVVGFLIRPSGAGFNPVFTITSGLTGALPAIFLWLLRGKNDSTIKVFIAIMFTQLLTSVIAVPLLRLYLYEHPLVLTMTKAAIKQAYSVPLYTFFYLSLNKALRNTHSFQLLKLKKAKRHV